MPSPAPARRSFRRIAIIVVVVVVAVIALIVLATVPVVAQSAHATVSCGGFGFFTRSFPSGTTVSIRWTTGSPSTNVTFSIYGGSLTSPTLYSQTASSGSTSFASSGGSYLFDCAYFGTGSVTPSVALTMNFTAPII